MSTALLNLRDANIKASDATVKNFLKIETSVKSSDPRNISPRSDLFLAIIGPYISALEHSMIAHPALVKGLNNEKRNQKLTPLLNFSDFIETDYQRFDLSISKPILQQVEYLFLTLPFQGPEHWLYRRVLRLAHSTFGLSDVGLTYRVDGTRCSGDAHTSLGNGLINHFNTWLVLQNLPFGSWISFHEGDDGIIGVRNDCIDQAKYNMHLLPCLGFQIKMDHFTSIDQTSFCGRFLSADRGVIISCADIFRSLAKLHTICSEGDPKSLFIAKMMSYYHTDRFTPIIGVFCYVAITLYRQTISVRQLQRAVRHIRIGYWAALKSEGIDYFNTDYVLCRATPELRALVANRCGLSPGTQILYEEYYLSFIKLGYIPSSIDKIPHDWNFDELSHVNGPLADMVL